MPPPFWKMSVPTGHILKVWNKHNIEELCNFNVGLHDSFKNLGPKLPLVIHFLPTKIIHAHVGFVRTYRMCATVQCTCMGNLGEGQTLPTFQTRHQHRWQGQEWQIWVRARWVQVQVYVGEVSPHGFNRWWKSTPPGNKLDIMELVLFLVFL